MLQEAWFGVLRCPKCQGELSQTQINDTLGLACVRDKILFPIRDGMPVMLIEQALPITVTTSDL